MRWNELKEQELPAELAKELEEQKEACNAIITAKDNLINALESELKTKDEEYMNALQQQKEDIALLLEKMKLQFNELREMYGEELENIENAFLKEREELLQNNKKEVDNLFEARRNMETKYTETRVEREEKYSTEIYDMQAADAENYQKLKVKLETDVAILEQQLEHMKYVYLLNTEKLEYNYRVLTERDNESKATLTAQKTRLARLRQALSKVQAEYEASDAKFKSRNTALTTEYQRTTRQYRDLQAKYRHFEAADHARYKSLITVHADEMKVMAARLLTADRVITEQLLGREWIAPSTGNVDNTNNENNEIINEDNGDIMNTFGIQAVENNLHAKSHGIDPNKLRSLLLLLVDECGAFLLDTATKDMCNKLEANGKEDAASALRSDAVLRGLGADTPATVSALVDGFENALSEAGHTANIGIDTEHSQEQPQVYSLSITDGEGFPILPPGFSPLQTLRNYIENARSGALPTNSINSTADVLRRIDQAVKGEMNEENNNNATAGTTAGDGTLASTTLYNKESSRWEKYANTVPANRIRVWKALENGMAKYETVLRKRNNILTDVENLTKANNELRQLLEMYLGAPKAVDLQVPPGATLRVGPHTQDVLQIAATVHYHGGSNFAPSSPNALSATSTTAAIQQHHQQQQLQNTINNKHTSTHTNNNTLRQSSTLPHTADSTTRALQATGGAPALYRPKQPI